MQAIAENLWTQSYPLSVLGTEHGRTCTVIRFPSRKLLIHSMAPFSSADIAVIHELGDPLWLVEAMMLHDTYAKEGRSAFPALPFYGPPGFSDVVEFSTRSLDEPPDEWEGIIKVIPLEGAPKLKEYAMIHVPTRTLIVADLVFNFRADEKGWDRFFHRHVAGFKRYPATSRLFKWCVADKGAFRTSIDRLLKEDFDRIIPGHGRLIPSGGKAAVESAMRDAQLI